MATRRITLLVGVLVGWLGSVAFAHGLGLLGTGKPHECAAELPVIFGRHTAFSALAHVIEKDPNASAPRTKEMPYYLDGLKLRLEQGAPKSAGSPGTGGDHWVWIHDFGRQTSLVLFPALKGYTELGREPSRQPNVAPRIEKVKVVEEAIDGRRCTKYRITAAEEGGAIEITTWEAEDVQHFPVQVEVPHGDMTYTVRFSDVKFRRPSASLFRVPDGYRHYENLDQLLQAIRERTGR